MEKDKRKALRRHIDIHAVEKSPNSKQFEYKKHRETSLVVCLCVSWAFGDALLLRQVNHYFYKTE